MVKTFRAVLAATLLAGSPAGLLFGSVAVAQTAGPEASAPKQVALDQTEIDNLVAAQKDMRTAEAGAPQDRPDPAIEAKVVAAAKKHGFDSLDRFADVSFSVGLVMSGIDPDTKEFIGAGAVIRKQIKQLQADASMPPKEKTEALAELNGALQEGTSDKPLPGNIAIVKANFDQLTHALQQAD